MISLKVLLFQQSIFYDKNIISNCNVENVNDL